MESAAFSSAPSSATNNSARSFSIMVHWTAIAAIRAASSGRWASSAGLMTRCLSPVTGCGMFPPEQAKEQDMAQNETGSERRDVGLGDAPGLEAFNALWRRILVIPPKPHSEMKLGKPRRPKRAKSGAESGPAPRQE